MYTKQQLKTRINRLSVLAAHLKNVSNKKFNLGYWVGHEYNYERTSNVEIVKAVCDHSCGTTACALGHAASIPSFRRAGLKYFVEYDGADILYKNSHNFVAGEHFFNISLEDSRYLFSPDEYNNGRKGKSYVIRRIEALIRKSEKELSKFSKPI